MSLLSVYILVAAAIIGVATATPKGPQGYKFNFTKCPAPHEIQSEWVHKNFNLTKFAGTYYELALHDYTQYPVCPGASCIRSVKEIDYEDKQVHDHWTLGCMGKPYPVELTFNFTDQPGVFMGYWHVIPGVIFPDTVVDVRLTEDGSYDWALEFQCVEWHGHVRFVGINFYSRRQCDRSTCASYIDEFEQTARDYGLGVYMDSGFKVYEPKFKNCSYKTEEPAYERQALSSMAMAEASMHGTFQVPEAMQSVAN